MSSVLARYEVSGERRKPKPSGSTSSVPSPKMDSPFFAWCLSMAKMRSCLRIRLAPSTPLVVAFSSRSETCRVLSSESCMLFRCDAPSIEWIAASAAADVFEKEDALDPARGCCHRAVVQSGAVRTQRVGFLDIAVKKGGQLRFG